MTSMEEQLVDVDDLTAELLAAAANLGMALARFQNELAKVKRDVQQRAT